MGVAKVTLNGTTLMDTTGMTVTSNTMVSAATALDKAGEVVTGTIATKTSNDITVNGSTVTVPAGVYNTAATKSVASAAAFAPAITLASSTGVVTGTNTFTAGYYAASTKTNTLNLTTQAAQTFTPASTSQYISSYRWLTGSQTIKGDPNLAPSNIASGVSIFGVTGTHQGGGDFTHTITLLNDGWYTAQGEEYGYLSYNGTSYRIKSIISYNANTKLSFYMSTATGNCKLYINDSLVSQSNHIYYSYTLTSYPVYVHFYHTISQKIINCYEDTVPVYIDANEVQY